MLALWPAELTARFFSTPTRTRTRNSSLGPRRDPPFHHRGKQRKARDSNPHPPRGGTALAGRLGQPYPTTFRSSGPTGSRTRISATPGRRHPLGPWALRFLSLSMLNGPPGSRTPISGVQSRCRPVGPAARLKRGTGREPTGRSPRLKVRPRIERGLPPYRGGVLPEHLQTGFLGVVPAGLEPALSCA